MPIRLISLSIAFQPRFAKLLRAAICSYCAVVLPAAYCLGQDVIQENKTLQLQDSVPNEDSGASQPTATKPISLEEAMQKPGDLSLRNSTIEGALFTIGKTWGVNIVVGEDVQGKVSSDFKQAPLKEVLDSILLANGYSYRPMGNSLVVQKASEFGNALPMFQSLTIPVVHGEINEIAKAAELLVSAQGKVTALVSARSILVVDFADRVKSVAQFIAHTEQAAAKALGVASAETNNQLEVAYYHTHYIPAENAKEPIAIVLSKQGRVSVMPLEDRLVVVDYAANIQLVERILARIDRPRPQIRLTALIYDISLQDVEKLGFNWNSVGKGNNLDANGVPQQAITLDTLTLTPFDAGATAGTLTVKSLTRNFDITAVALALQTADDARLLADPNVTVMDNEQAEWKSVTEIPYQQLTQTQNAGSIGTTAFKEAGITLRVVPKIAGDGTIELFVEPEFSRLSGFTPEENQPIIDTRRTSTTVRVANRQTLVLSGLRQRSDTGNFIGIPFLKDMRFIGPVFRSRDTTVRESELIVFIMPEIIGYNDAPNSRQAMAQETVGCKLGKIPMAEGCLSTSGASCASFDIANNPGGLIRLPSVDSQVSFERDDPTPNEAKGFSAAMLSDSKRLRSPYQDRFRATGDTDPPPQRQHQPEAAPLPSAKKHKKKSKKPIVWSHLFGS